MNKKICVYAIAKNEIKFIDRWYDSIKEADYICVLDTGSTDGTFERLKKLGIKTEQKIYENFRFDTARNDSMKLIPNDADICVCIDIDEVIQSGWSSILKEEWKSNTTRAKYKYVWSFNSDGSEGVVFLADKIHANKLYNWINPVHEILHTDKREEYITLSLQINHHADNTKSRSNYLPLLKLACKEDPTNDRNIHYLGREYMFYHEYDKAIKTLKKHLKLPTATWNEERCASLRYIAHCYSQKNNKKLAEKYYLLAILENNTVREPYYELGVFYFDNKDYLRASIMFEEMLKIKTRSLSYISSPICWRDAPYDYLSICYYNLGNIKKAISNAEIAISINPNIRLKQNRDYFLSITNQTEN